MPAESIRAVLTAKFDQPNQSSNRCTDKDICKGKWIPYVLCLSCQQTKEHPPTCVEAFLNANITSLATAKTNWRSNSLLRRFRWRAKPTLESSTASSRTTFQCADICIWRASNSLPNDEASTYLAHRPSDKDIIWQGAGDVKPRACKTHGGRFRGRTGS